MADVGAAIVARLEGDLAWTELIGDRVDWGASLPETPYPRAVANWITRDRPDHYGGSDMEFSRLQLDVYSSVSSGEAAEIAEVAIGVLQPEDAAEGVRFERAVEVSGPTDGGEQTETIYAYRARLELAFLHAPSDGEEPPPVEESLSWSEIKW